jgi:maleylacetate reductase
MIESFVYNANPARVIFGAGSAASIGAELARLGCKRALILTTPDQAELGMSTSANLGDQAGGLFSRATMHTPISVTDDAMRELQSLGCDGIIAIGGGSTIGLGKALAIRTDLPQIAVPTTYAGSEMTPILGETKDGHKTTVRSSKVLPEVVIYDVELTLSLPGKLSAVSGMNALAHAVEALYAKDANPITSLMAVEGITALGRSLPQILASPRDLEARSDAQYGGWLCGACLGVVGMALHHKICHVLGGKFELPHAETHAVILPHAAAYNQDAAPAAMARVASALHAPNAADALRNLSKSLGAPLSLKELGMPEAGIVTAAELVLRDAYWNPRLLDKDLIHAMLAGAWRGDPPC